MTTFLGCNHFILGKMEIQRLRTGDGYDGIQLHEELSAFLVNDRISIPEQRISGQRQLSCIVNVDAGRWTVGHGVVVDHNVAGPVIDVNAAHKQLIGIGGPRSRSDPMEYDISFYAITAEGVIPRIHTRTIIFDHAKITDQVVLNSRSACSK